MIFGFHCRNLLQFIQRLTWKYFLVLFVFSTQKQRSPVDQIQCEENCCTIAVGCRGSLCTMFFVYCFTEFFFLTHTHTDSHTLSFSFQTHTRTQWLLRCIQAWRRIGFVTHLNWDRGNSALRVLGEAVSLLFPLWGHTMLTEWPTKQHVSVQPLPVSFIHHWNPSVWSEEELLLFYTSAFLVLLSYSYKIPRGA